MSAPPPPLSPPPSLPPVLPSSPPPSGPPPTLPSSLPPTLPPPSLPPNIPPLTLPPNLPPPALTAPTIPPPLLTPPNIPPPTLSPPTLSPPTLSPPTLSPPTLSPPTLSPPPPLPSPSSTTAAEPDSPDGDGDEEDGVDALLQLAEEAPAPASPAPAAAAAKPLDLRKLTLNEVFQTEADYVQDLSFVIEIYIKPLRDRQDLLPREQLPSIFSNIELLKNVNQELLLQIRRCWQKQSDRKGTEITGIGEILLEHSDRLKVYDQYCNTHASCVENLMKLRSDRPKFAAFLDEVKTKDNFPIDLRDFLIKPIQRICKYPLLIREVLKHTPEDHPDHPLLEETLRKLNEVTRQVNQTKRDFENKQKLLEIEKQIDGTGKLPGGRVSVAGRIFFREGTLSKVNPKGVIQSRQFHLFSDILVWSKKNMGKHSTFKGMLRLDLAVCRTTPDDEKKKIKHAFQIIRMDTKKIYTMMAENEAEKNDWMKDLDRIINKHLGVQESEDDPSSSSSTSSSSSAGGPAQAAASPSQERRTGRATNRSSVNMKPASVDDHALFLTQLTELESLFQAERARRVQLEEMCDFLMHRVLELEQKKSANAKG